MKRQPSSPREEPAAGERIRLHKYLASAGVASRRQCETLMLEGRVTVDGREVRDLGFSIEPEGHDVRVDGEAVAPQPKHYFLLNKPAGYVCTHRDPAGRPQAVDLVGISGLALFTVGRLDEQSEGLLVVTNDGGLANRMAHPSYRMERTYRVEVAGRPTPEVLGQLRKGMYFEEGFFRMKDVRVVKAQGQNTLLEVVLTEGKNREIRRLLARVGHKVVHLERIGFGPLRLGKLPVGEFRPLTPNELTSLLSAAKPRRRRTPAGAGGAAGRKRSTGGDRREASAPGGKPSRTKSSRPKKPRRGETRRR